MRRADLVGPAIVVALFVATTPVYSQAQIPQAGRKFALLVGVRQYDPNELRSLPYSEPDVVELGQVLRDAGYRQVVMLTQTAGVENFRLSPTAANIRTTLTGMLEDRVAGDTVVVAFAGHGVQFRGSPENFFCPMDARLADRSTLISLGEVYKDLSACGAGTKVLLVDACRNDPQSDNSRARSLVRLESVTRPQQARPPGGVAALFSCSEGERSFEHQRLKHGVFYHFVIQGLRGEADVNRDGNVGVEELALFTKSNVPEFVKEEYGFDVRQMPVLRGEIGGLAALVSRAPSRNDVAAPTPARTTSPPPAPGPTASTPSEGLKGGGLKGGDPKIVAARDSNSLKNPVATSARKAETITNSIGMALARIPAGEFLMGSPDTDRDALAHEKPQHPVKISRPFYLGVHEVTQAQFKQVTGENPSRFAGSDDLPVDRVNWYEAIDFCNALSAKEKRTPYYRVTPALKGGEPTVEIAGGTGYRLPTEAEWEYACRAGTTTRYVYGDDESVAATRSWSGVNSGQKSHPVGEMPANAFGLHDMHGNLWEWCFDWYSDPTLAKGARTDDPTGPATGVARVVKGGSWYNALTALRSAHRWAFRPSGHLHQFGFRVARDVE